MKIIPSSWVCSCCGKTHTGLPLDYTVYFPDYYAEWRNGLTNQEIEERSLFNEILCMVDDQYYFASGVIELPILGFPQDKFRWGVWVSVSNNSFSEIVKTVQDEGFCKEPYFGWLNSTLPHYTPSTLNLKANLHVRGPGRRPWIELEPTDHPLALEQRNGITIERVQEIAAALLHQSNPEKENI